MTMKLILKQKNNERETLTIVNTGFGVLTQSKVFLTKTSKT